MPYRKEQFENGEPYHTVIKTIDNKLLFEDINDHYRGVFSIYEFNNSQPVDMRERRKERARLKELIKRGVEDPVSAAVKEEKRRSKFVDVLCFCLMPNHLHLLLRQLQDGGITKFMHKLDLGLGSYFNAKHQRKGPVFQNRFVAVRIISEKQLQHTFVYIHTNPIAIIEPKWKELGIINPEKAIKFLEEKYRWSSYWDCLGKKNFPSVTERAFLLEIMGGPSGCKQYVDEWIQHKEELRKIITEIEKSLREAQKQVK